MVELDLRPPVPGPKALAGWKRGAPEGFVFSAVAPPTLFGDRDFPLKNEAQVKSESDRLANNLNALGAAIVVLRTPMAVTPGSAALKRFMPVLERAKKWAKTVVWEPSGLWERDAAVALAEPLGVVVAGDPLHDEMEGDAVVYARLRGLGNDARYSPARLEDLLAKLEGAETAYVIFASDNAWKESATLSRLAGTLAEGDDGEEEDEEGEEGDEDDEDDEDFEDDEDGDEA